MSALVAATVIAARSGDRDHGPGTPGGDLPRYLPTWLPDDVEPIGEDRSEPLERPLARSETLYLGRAPGDVPLVLVFRLATVTATNTADASSGAATTTAAEGAAGDVEIGEFGGRSTRSIVLQYVFAPRSGSGVGVLVEVRTASNADTLHRVFFGSSTAEPVRGHPAFAPNVSGMGYSGVEWNEGPGLVITVQADGEPSTVRRVAESLREVSAEEWARRARAAKDQPMPGR